MTPLQELVLEMGRIIRRLDEDNEYLEFWTQDGDYLLDGRWEQPTPPSGWRPAESAPRDGTPVEVRYEDGTAETGVYWRDDRQCMLGSRAGECGPGWVSKEAGNLPVEGVVEFRPAPVSGEGE